MTPPPSSSRSMPAASARAGLSWGTGVQRALLAISRQLQDLQRDKLRLRTATISSFTASDAVILLGDASITGVDYLRSYAPTIGDVVLVLQAPAQMVIIGKVQ